MSFLGNVNIPLLSIPAYFVLALYPHGYATVVSTQGKRGVHDNRNPKSTRVVDDIRKRLGPKEFERYERGESCHRNALENMPLYVSAILAGLLAQAKNNDVDVVGVRSFALGFMALRVAYTVNYLVTETKRWSYLRSLLWFVSTSWAFTVLIKAAYAIGA